MRKNQAVGIAFITGMIVLAGYFFQSQLGPVLAVIVDWGILLVGVIGLIGIGYLVWMHFDKLRQHEKGSFFSMVVLFGFILTLVTGLLLTPQNVFYRDLILNIQVPVEASLLAVLAVTLLYTSLRLVRTRGYTPMSIGFVLSALVMLFLNLGYLQADPGTIAAELVAFLQRLPMVGARGILLGIALGGLIVGLRVLLTINRPYGGQ